MSNQSRGRKKSQFVSQSTVLDTDTLDFVTGSTNRKIAFSDFKAQLGVTGTIQQEGDPLGTPILNQSGDVNNIRNLESGSGIITSVSPQGGAEVSHNFQQDTTGQQIVDDLTVDSPTFASIQPGTGIQVSKADDVITITATGSLPATKTVTVNSIDDFPVADSGVITLEPETVYVIANDITTSNRFVLQDRTTVSGSSSIGPLLEYTGSGNMFTATDSQVLFQNLRKKCSSGKLFDITDTTGNTKICAIVNCECVEANEYGDFTGLFAINVFNSNCLNNITSGPKFYGTGWQLISFDRFGLFSTNASYSGIGLGTSVADAVEIGDLFINSPSGSTAITGAASSANIASGGIGTISNSNFSGGVTPLSGIDTDNDIRWAAVGNDDIPDSTTDALISIQSNSTETVISVAGTPVLMAGTWTDEDSSKFTSDTSGRMTYNGERDDRLPIDVTVTALAASGGDKQISAYIAINGSVVSATKKVGTASSSKAASITMIWQHNFQTNDYVEVWLANETDTTNVIGEGAVGRIN